MDIQGAAFVMLASAAAVGCTAGATTIGEGGGAAVAAAVADSVAHPIVAACGERIDPPAYLRGLMGEEELGSEEAVALERLERDLRRSNAPLGEAWHDGATGQEERAAVLTGLQANYRAWWREVEEVLGQQRAHVYLDPPATTAAGAARSARVRCVGRSLLAIVGLGK